MVQNNQYVPLAYTPISLQTFVGSNSVSTQSQTNLPLYSALTIGAPTISRTNNKANQQATLTISFTAPSLASFTLGVAPMLLSSASIQLLSGITFVGLSQAQSLSYNMNSSGYLSVSMSNNQAGTTS